MAFSAFLAFCVPVADLILAAMAGTLRCAVKCLCGAGFPSRMVRKRDRSALIHKHAPRIPKQAPKQPYSPKTARFGPFPPLCRYVFVFERRARGLRGAPHLIRRPNIYPNCRCSNRVDEAMYTIDVPAFCGFGPFWGSFSVSLRVRVVLLFGLCLGSGRNLFLQICVWARVASHVALL